MRILWVGPVPPHRGGSGISLGEIASEVARAGNPIQVIAPITEETQAAGERFAASHPELAIERYLIPAYDLTPYRQNRDELVQAEGSALSTLFPAPVRRFRPELVVSGRESVSRFVVPLAQAHGLPCAQLVRGSPTGELLRGVFPRAQTERLLRDLGEADQVVTVASFQEHGLRRLGLTNVTTIPNAIDTSVFRPRPGGGELSKELRIRPNQIVIVVPANLTSRKRPLDVVESAAVALTANPELLYIMPGDGDLAGQVKQQCSQRGIRQSFRFPGWIDYERMPEMMHLADVVVMASESEGMARAYLEAMACERLLLASDIPSARELIRDGENGLLFPVGDTQSLAALTLRVAADPGTRRRLGQAGRRSLVGRSLAEAGRRYVDVLSAVARGAAPVGKVASVEEGQE